MGSKNIGDFIKVDIESTERLLLQGAKNVIKDFTFKIAICTYHLPDDSKVMRRVCKRRIAHH